MAKFIMPTGRPPSWASHIIRRDDSRANQAAGSRRSPGLQCLRPLLGSTRDAVGLSLLDRRVRPGGSKRQSCSTTYLHDGHYRLQIAPSIRVCPARGTCLADLKAKLWVILCEFFRGDSAFLFL